MYNDLCDSDATVEEIEDQIQQEIDFVTYFKLMLEFHKEFKSSTPVTFTMLTNTLVSSILDERSNDSLSISNIAGVAQTADATNDTSPTGGQAYIYFVVIYFVFVCWVKRHDVVLVSRLSNWSHLVR